MQPLFLKRFLSLVIACVLLLTSSAHAQVSTVVCTGTVAELGIHLPDKVYVRLTSMNAGVLICSMDAAWVVQGTQYGNTSPSTCKAIYSTLLAAKLSQSSIQSMYMDGVVPSSCNSFSPWTPVSVRFTTF